MQIVHIKNVVPLVLIGIYVDIVVTCDEVSVALKSIFIYLFIVTLRSHD